MLEMLAEESDRWHCYQYEEVQYHQQVICNRCSRYHVARYIECCSKSGKVYRTSDIGSGKYARKSGKFRNKFVERRISKKRAASGTYRADQEYNQDTSGFLSDLSNIALQ